MTQNMESWDGRRDGAGHDDIDDNAPLPAFVIGKDLVAWCDACWRFHFHEATQQELRPGQRVWRPARCETHRRVGHDVVRWLSPYASRGYVLENRGAPSLSTLRLIREQLASIADGSYERSGINLASSRKALRKAV